MSEYHLEPVVAEPEYRCPLCCAETAEECICEGPAGDARFVIDSEERAEWLLGKLSDLDAAHDRILVNSVDMLKRVAIRKQCLLRRFGAELQDYCDGLRLAPGFRGKTVNFLQGKCAWRSSKTGGPKVTDTEAALAYCQEHDELMDACVTVSYRLRTTDYLKQMEATGELLPGIEVLPEQEQESFYINGAALYRTPKEPEDMK